jgi:hypothetical protein
MIRTGGRGVPPLQFSHKQVATSQRFEKRDEGLGGRHALDRGRRDVP